MASETATRTDVRTRTTLEPWQAGVVGGVGGSVVFGVLLSLLAPEMLAGMIPAMYGLEGGLAGWIIHVSHGAVLGVVFATLLTVAGKADLSAPAAGVVGVGYGIVVWATLAVIVMPVWLGMAEMVPNLDMGSLVGHALYGLVLGVAYAVFSR